MGGSWLGLIGMLRPCGSARRGIPMYDGRMRKGREGIFSNASTPSLTSQKLRAYSIRKSIPTVDRIYVLHRFKLFSHCLSSVSNPQRIHGVSRSHQYVLKTPSFHNRTSLLPYLITTQRAASSAWPRSISLISRIRIILLILHLLQLPVRLLPILDRKLILLQHHLPNMHTDNRHCKGIPYVHARFAEIERRDEP